MTWEEALYNFFSGFGLDAFAENAVPEKTRFPWLTYSVSRGSFDTTTSNTVHLHHYTESEAVPNAKADEICNAVNGAIIPYDKGKMLLFTGSPEWFSAEDGNDRYHKHRLINVMIHW